MNIRCLAAATVVASVFLTAGCKPKPITGTWIQESDSKLKHELRLYSDGTYVDTVYKFILAERIVVRGTYTYDGRRLVAKPKTANVENAPTYAEQLKREKMLPKSIMDPDVGSVEWIDDNSFRYTPDKDKTAASVFRRKP